MTYRDNIIELLPELGVVSYPEDENLLTRENPAFFSPDGLNTKYVAWVYTRYNGTEVLRINAISSETRCPNLDLFIRWVACQPSAMPFASMRLIPGTDSRVKIEVSHTMVARDVTRASLSEVLDGIEFMFKKAVAKLAEIICDADDEDNDPSLEELVGESPSLSNNDDRVVDDGDIYAAAGAGRILRASDRSTQSILKELDSLIGLAPAKALARQLTAQRAIAKQREQRGMKAIAPSPHLVFTGNPGTGKTTVARLIGQLYKSLGLLSSGHVIEADRATLVSGYLGQTALKTRDVCKRALNGVLFIDEAYGLAVDGRDYGTEVIETLLTFMEAHRGDFVVVVAGYPDKMQKFLKSNPGLASRFDLTVDFPDYTDDELIQIFEDLVDQNQYSLTDGARRRLRLEIGNWIRVEAFGNARDVRKLFNNVVSAQAMLLAKRKRFPETDLSLLTEDAFPLPSLVMTGHHLREGLRSSGGYL